MDPHEEAFLKGFNPKFDDKTDSFWGYGGAVWVLNGALESGANADGQRFMQARKVPTFSFSCMLPYKYYTTHNTHFTSLIR
jgi:hypothetical protein